MRQASMECIALPGIGRALHQLYQCGDCAVKSASYNLCHAKAAYRMFGLNKYVAAPNDRRRYRRLCSLGIYD
jgi:hypothetical protein